MASGSMATGGVTASNVTGSVAASDVTVNVPMLLCRARAYGDIQRVVGCC